MCEEIDAIMAGLIQRDGLHNMHAVMVAVAFSLDEAKINKHNRQAAMKRAERKEAGNRQAQQAEFELCPRFSPCTRMISAETRDCFIHHRHHFNSASRTK